MNENFALMMDDYDLTAQRKLIIALDVANADLADALIDTIALPFVTYKVGLELLFAGGIPLVQRLASEGRPVFVDAKFLDIPATVERATARVAGLGAAFLTIHAHDEKTVEAAVRGRAQSSLQLLGVTVLTSSSDLALRAQGVDMRASQLVMRRAAIAATCGCDGVVASPLEAQEIRAAFGDQLRIVTPGIRPAWASDISHDDQARSATPVFAIRAGADYVVVGRPITRAADPAKAARDVIAEIAQALSAPSAA